MKLKIYVLNSHHTISDIWKDSPIESKDYSITNKKKLSTMLKAAKKNQDAILFVINASNLEKKTLIPKELINIPVAIFSNNGSVTKEIQNLGFIHFDHFTLDSANQEFNLRIQNLLNIGHLERANKDLRIAENNYRSFAAIGLALSSEKNLDRLLEKIVDEARLLTNADAGTLYIVDDAKEHLNFKILQTETMGVRMGGTSEVPISLPPVPLQRESGPNYANVCSYTALTQIKVNIPDVYEAEGFDFSGTRSYDESTGYRSKSMLVIPLQNHENDTIGVLQLLNAIDPNDPKKVIPFSPDLEDLIGSLASQTAIALTKMQLINDLRELLYSFIRSIAAAIDEKSKYTGGHIRRVVDLTMLIAEGVNRSDNEHFSDINLTEDQLEELRLATWMHDIGKITTPQYVMDKTTKLETISDKLEVIEARYKFLKVQAENQILKRLLKDSQSSIPKETQDEINKVMTELDEEFDFIKECNHSREFMNEDMFKRMQDIHKKSIVINDSKQKFITDYEYSQLVIRKGNLSADERKIMQHHADMTIKMLSNLPFPRKLSQVPTYAGQHHEKLDGSGYPNGLKEEELPLQSRIMAIADIFEALTARDRPYKKPMKLSKAVEIMGFMVKDHHIDKHLYDLFVKQKLYLDYANKELDPSQIDEKN